MNKKEKIKLQFTDKAIENFNPSEDDYSFVDKLSQTIKLKKPFVGRAGKLLDELLNRIHLDRTKVYITNVVNYRPDKNRKPTPEEINEFKKILF